VTFYVFFEWLTTFSRTLAWMLGRVSDAIKATLPVDNESHELGWR